jgi:hypothetical protein
MRELTELLEAAGHSDFRDARGPMGFTQRQAGGKFTRDEADEFIARLQHEAEDTDSPSTDADDGPTPDPAPTAKPAAKTSAAAYRRAAKRPTPGEQTFRGFTDAELAAELQRRGWVVMEP